MIISLHSVSLAVTPHELAIILSALLQRVEMLDAAYRGAEGTDAIKHHASRLLACQDLLERVKDGYETVGDAADRLALFYKV